MSFIAYPTHMYLAGHGRRCGCVRPAPRGAAQGLRRAHLRGARPGRRRSASLSYWTARRTASRPQAPSSSAAASSPGPTRERDGGESWPRRLFPDRRRPGRCPPTRAGPRVAKRPDGGANREQVTHWSPTRHADAIASALSTDLTREATTLLSPRVLAGARRWCDDGLFASSESC